MRTVITLILLLSLFPASGAFADFVIHDETFNNADWQLVPGSNVNVSSMIAFQEPNGVTGNRRTTQVFGRSPITYEARHFFNAQVWDSNLYGEITSISYQLWYLFPGGDSRWAILKLIARQNGSQYVANNTYKEPQDASRFWQKASGVITGNDFVLMQGNGPSRLDFSSSAAPIEFGYMQFSGVALRTSFVTHSVSFFDMQIKCLARPAAAPEPETLPLLLSGVSFLGFIICNRRSE